MAQDNPVAAQRVAQKLWDAARRLSDHPHIGRRGRRSETREWIVSGTPYLLVYRVRNDCLEILRAWHMKRVWETPGKSDNNES
ncbi:MAG: type II toxin-antitoxin system RelE/ParE family toxin [Gammaproteobacteria bacterium]